MITALAASAIPVSAVPVSAMPGPSAASRVLADSDVGKGSPIGLLVVLLLVVAVYFLYRSMNRHIRNVPGQFDKPRESDQPGKLDAPGDPSRQDFARQQPEVPEPGTQDRERRPDVPGDSSE